jgi:hypothetical protein
MRERGCTHSAAAGAEEHHIGWEAGMGIGPVEEVNRTVLVEERHTGPWQGGGTGPGAACRIGWALEGIVLVVGMRHIGLEAAVRHTDPVLGMHHIDLVVGVRHTGPVVGVHHTDPVGRTG